MNKGKIWHFNLFVLRSAAGNSLGFLKLIKFMSSGFALNCEVLVCCKQRRLAFCWKKRKKCLGVCAYECVSVHISKFICMFLYFCSQLADLHRMSCLWSVFLFLPSFAVFLNMLLAIKFCPGCSRPNPELFHGFCRVARGSEMCNWDQSLANGLRWFSWELTIN